jgi:1,4-dihydroxy-6-naphthoate synthase
MSRRLTLGFSPCPNDTFLFHAMTHGLVRDPDLRFDVVFGDVEELNQAALSGELDLTKLSYAALGPVLSEYALLRAGSALGRGVGPLLVARDPEAMSRLEQAPSNMRIAIPGEHTTAHFLLRWAFPQLMDRTPLLFSDIEDAVLDGRFDAGLLIHENRFTYAERGLHLLADLGERWEAGTGLPIPLGGIAARRSLGSETIHKVDALLRRSVEYAFAHPEASRDFVHKHAQEMDPDVQRKHIGLYVNDYTIDLGQDGEKAVRELLRAGGYSDPLLFA